MCVFYLYVLSLGRKMGLDIPLLQRSLNIQRTQIHALLILHEPPFECALYTHTKRNFSVGTYALLNINSMSRPIGGIALCDSDRLRYLVQYT
jgi:hypothetical protein